MRTGYRKKERYHLQRLAAGEAVSSSAMSESMRSACSLGWLAAGLVECEAIGLRRKVYRPVPARLADFRQVLERTYPGYADELPADMSRAQAARMQGNSKLAPLDDGLVVLRDPRGVIRSNVAGSDLHAFWLSAIENVALPAGLKVLTVENEDSFQKAASGESELPHFDIAVLTAGNPSVRMVQWLSSIPNSVLVHYGDFDWEGLRIYQMIRKHFGRPECQLHRPAALEAAFARQRALGKGSMANHQRRPAAECEEVAEVLALIDRHGCVGVEQQVFD